MEAWLYFHNPTQIQLSLIVVQKQDLLINPGEAQSHLLLRTFYAFPFNVLKLLSLNSVIYGVL